MSKGEVIEIPQAKPTDLSVAFTDGAIQALKVQLEQLHSFITSQLREGLDGDYAKIPGTPKKSLLQPGAQKLAKLFQLGSRIVDVQREIDPGKQFAMFTYTVEVFHIPTGKAIAQCQGSANTLEKKQQNKDFGFQINSLGKIAQKRAYVGAVISAVGASDFLTQDMEEGDGGPARPEPARVQVNIPKPTAASSQNMGQGAGDFVIPFGQQKGTKLSALSQEELQNLKTWIDGLENPKGTALQTKEALYAFLGVK